MTSTLSVLDVGHGSSSVLMSCGKTVVIDTADRTHLLHYLECKGIEEIDMIIISHTDSDHIGGLINILANPKYVIKHLVLNCDSKKQSKLWGDVRTLVDDLMSRGAITVTMGVSASQAYGWANVSDEVSIEIVSPTPLMALTGAGSALPKSAKALTSNSISIVARILFKGSPVALVTADMDRLALDEILRSECAVESKYLVFPHHGGLPGGDDPAKFTEDLLSVVKPDAVIFSNGRGRHGTPRAEIIEAIKICLPTVKIACTQLAVKCCEKPLSRDDFKPFVYSAGAGSHSFCAGTIEIDLETGLADNRMLQAHSSFVSGLPSSLCTIPVVMLPIT
jgi:competence protein ComEC